MFSAAPFSGWVEFCPGFSPRPNLSHVVFDFDGTLSWLRHGWPELMYRLFREQLTLRPGETEAALHDGLLADILSLNGKPSIYQMRLGAQRIAEHGAAQTDPESLLQEYQRRLDAVIAERTAAIKSGQVSREHFVVHGARALLERLRARGLTLVILRGTAEPRVKQEAALLDLARYFGDHIYGGTADAAQSSKRAVIDRLLREEKLAGENLLSVGDGPVEIRLTKEVGGLAIGVASDEEQNGSGQCHPQKLPQLRAAGADLLLPDYRDTDALLEHVFGT